MNAQFLIELRTHRPAIQYKGKLILFSKAQARLLSMVIPIEYRLSETRAGTPIVIIL